MRLYAHLSPEELPGVQKKSFTMAFDGGEIWFEHLDGMYGYEVLVLQKLRDDAKQFLRPSAPSLIAVNVDETQMSEAILVELTQLLTKRHRQFTRVVFVGMERQKRRQLRRMLADAQAEFAVTFQDDFERAKQWLVSEQWENRNGGNENA